MDADVRGNSDVSVGPNGQTVLASDFGTHVLPADKAASYEFGYRAQAGEQL